MFARYIHPRYVELCVYTVNDWIGTVYLVIRLYEKMILSEILIEIWARP